jgi:hypothetical protein
MSISYSGIIGHTAKVTLPSVEFGLGSINILRDPPKSIHTRRRNKVGETSSITAMIDESGSRACEAILQYPRGINPFAKVSYQNYGNNGGQRSGGITKGGGRQAYLPYNLGQGAFRPPIMRQEQLFPLSRLPRNSREVLTNPRINKFVSQGSCPNIGDPYKGVKKSQITCNVRPTATFVIQTPLTAPSDVHTSINNKKLSVSAHSGICASDQTKQVVGTPCKNIIISPIHSHVTANTGSSTLQKSGDTTFSTERFIQDKLYSNVTANKNRNIQILGLEDVMDVDVRTRDRPNMSCSTAIAGIKNEEFLSRDYNTHRDVLPVYSQTNHGRDIYIPQESVHTQSLSRNYPISSMMTNSGMTRGIDTISSRDYYLPPKNNAGSYAGRAQKPMTERMQNVNEGFVTRKSLMNKKILEQTLSRNAHLI